MHVHKQSFAVVIVIAKFKDCINLCMLDHVVVLVIEELDFAKTLVPNNLMLVAIESDFFNFAMLNAECAMKDFRCLTLLEKFLCGFYTAGKLCLACLAQAVNSTCSFYVNCH